MIPSKYHYGQNNIVGLRPSPLKINKESHLIHKSSSTSNSSSSICAIGLPVVGVKQQQQKNQPVIIYTHSPKVIHTQAKDFMALVQKLTGFSRSDNLETASPAQHREDQGLDSTGLKSANGNSHASKCVGRDDNESSSISTEENCHGAAAAGVDTVISPIFKPPNAHYFADVPLFTPTSADFFFSPRPVFGCPVSVFTSPKMGNPISPSVLEFMKDLPQY